MLASQRPFALSRNLPGALLRQHYLANLKLKLKVLLCEYKYMIVEEVVVARFSAQCPYIDLFF